MTSPDHLRPDGTQIGTTVGPYYQNADNSAIGRSKNAEMNSLLGLMQNNFFFQILGGFASAVSAVADGITSIVEAITGILGGTLGDLDRWSNDIVDGQLALNESVDLLSPLQDYGSCYAKGSGDLINLGKVPFNQQIGPMTNCHLASSGIVLEDKGLWDIRARLAFSYTVGGGGIAWEIRIVKDSDGSIFSVQKDYVVDKESCTREMNTTVVIPTGGYRAEVWITTLVIGRATTGGPSYNRLTAQHITRSTVNPI
ncbi:hypothetical protein [Gordonia sp. SND2]|uniref:hypothetical protein n=1 Tax=Gordonia sp. SND2 TaxID=3388659 RepID=UPI00398AF90F